ncbi:MAG: eL32 family ribosomal protein [Nanoarchaeota archaeon]
MMNEKLLELRKAMKSRKPNFKIQNSNDPKKRFAGRWKRPKGLQSKMRERRKGNPRYIEPGYGSPAAVRGATPEGFFPVVVRSLSDLASVKEGAGVIVSASVGMRKKAELIKAAVERKLRLLNVNADDFAKKTADFMSSRKKRRSELMQKRKVKSETKKQQAQTPVPTETSTATSATTGVRANGDGEKGENIEAKLGEDKRKAEKAEKDKVLTKAR